jgi:hypothetical protein
VLCCEWYPCLNTATMKVIEKAMARAGQRPSNLRRARPSLVLPVTLYARYRRIASIRPIDAASNKAGKARSESCSAHSERDIRLSSACMPFKLGIISLFKINILFIKMHQDSRARALGVHSSLTRPHLSPRVICAFASGRDAFTYCRP